MVSRRRILGRSQDNIHLDNYQEEEEDVYYTKERLLKEHIQEVLMKWEQIDDEIWSKVIVLERNRRVAKAYARAPVLTVNGSDDGFDGYRIGLCGFDNPMRDPRTDEIKRHIGHGVKVKMDDQGNILIKRVSKAGVYVKMTSDDNAISNDILRLPNLGLENEKPVMLFDMNKFQQNVKREMRRQYPDRSKLETQCVCLIAFVKNEQDILDCPIWVMIINIVAMDMLKSKLPPVRVLPNIRNRPRIPIPDEDPYSVAGGSGASSGSSGKDRAGKDKPPKLPPRDSPNHPVPGPRPNGKSDALDENAFRKLQSRNNNNNNNNRSQDRKYDDPYYCGLRARIPNFAKPKSKDKQDVVRAQYPPPVPAHPMWHTRSFDSGMGKTSSSSSSPFPATAIDTPSSSFATLSSPHISSSSPSATATLPPLAHAGGEPLYSSSPSFSPHTQHLLTHRHGFHHHHHHHHRRHQSPRRLQDHQHHHQQQQRRQQDLYHDRRTYLYTLSSPSSLPSSPSSHLALSGPSPLPRWLPKPALPHLSQSPMSLPAFVNPAGGDVSPDAYESE